MRIVTWNVNGLRSLLRVKGEGLKQILESLNGDIICLQETKATSADIPIVQHRQ